MSNWLSLDTEQQVDLITQAGAETGLPLFAIEKDKVISIPVAEIEKANIVAKF